MDSKQEHANAGLQCARDFDLVKGLPTALVITAENDYCVMKARLMPIRGKTSVNIRPNYWRKIEVDYEG